MSFDLYSYLTHDKYFTPMVQFVDVYVNDVYQGVYNLCDQVETGDSRIQISGKKKDTPEITDYLIVQDKRVYYDNSGLEEGIDWFWLNKENVSFEVKSPDTEKDYSSEYTQYIKEYMDATYDYILKKDWNKIQEMIDVDSFIYGFMVNEIIKNQDADKSSIYYSLPHDGKLTFATIWDCDLAFGSGEIGDIEGVNAELNPIFKALMEVPEFKAKYIQTFNDCILDVESHIISTIDDIYSKYSIELENDYTNWACKYTYCNSDMVGLSYNEQIEYMKNWISNRIKWLISYYN